MDKFRYINLSRHRRVLRAADRSTQVWQIYPPSTDIHGASTTCQALSLGHSSRCDDPKALPPGVHATLPRPGRAPLRNHSVLSCLPHHHSQQRSRRPTQSNSGREQSASHAAMNQGINSLKERQGHPRRKPREASADEWAGSPWCHTQAHRPAFGTGLVWEEGASFTASGCQFLSLIPWSCGKGCFNPELGSRRDTEQLGICPFSFFALQCYFFIQLLSKNF